MAASLAVLAEFLVMILAASLVVIPSVLNASPTVVLDAPLVVVLAVLHASLVMVLAASLS